ncbi:MAG: penicillin-binding transpeptidase domain-containing protein, partial [Wujia sp.]
IRENSNAAITENCDRLPGMSVSVKSLRRYNDAKYYAHIIGYIGGISDEELKKYNEELPVEQQYSAGEMVGKTGIEQYCESELRGESGYETMYVDNLGKMIETVDSKQATAGNDVYLTIDADLQKYCYDTLEKEIASIILANLANVASVPTDENSAIPITDVYFGLFDNNYLKIDSMGDSDATELEKQIYNKFVNKKETTLNKIEDILKIDHTPLYNLNTEYQNHMEYICEILSKNGIYNRSLVSSTSDEFVKYTSNQSSLEEYLKYCISIEAIDISAFEADSNYYDTDEIYDLLCDYIVNYLSLDTEFDKRLIENMIYSSEITGYDVVNLIYDQGILNPEGDEEYDNFKNGVYGPYEFMQHKIKNLEITPAMLALDPCSGAVIVTDVNSGDVLAMVSYPGYDNNYLTNEVDADYYEMLLNDKTSPMYSKATQQQTAPGSTFKLMSSIVGLSEGVVDQSTRTYCSGLYDEIYPPAQCWIYPGGHGYLEIEEALQRSCNVYFYNIGYNLSIMPDGSFSSNYGLSRIQKYATLFGLNDLSGVELPEVPPHISDDDSIRTCIGQGTNSYAPVQLARYVTTIANSGTCYNLTLIDKITDYSGNVIRDNSASVLYNVDLPESTWNSVHNGMRRATSYLSSTYLINNINVAVAGKTGTAQEDRTRYNHALYVSYAPFEEPEVSVTCVIQHGYSSGNPRELASFIYAYMYDPEALVGAEMKGNIMVSD